jgi:dihydroorotate dehydrogenase
MIKSSNGHILEYIAGSGALGFDGKGYLWQLPWKWVGLLKPELFTIVLKTITKYERQGNSKCYWPYGTVKHIEFEGKQGIVNAKGLGNPGIEKWCTKYAPRIDWGNANLIASVYAENKEELCELTGTLNRYPFKAIEINALCPNVTAPIIQRSYFRATRARNNMENGKRNR